MRPGNPEIRSETHFFARSAVFDPYFYWKTVFGHSDITRITRKRSFPAICACKSGRRRENLCPAVVADGIFKAKAGGRMSVAEDGAARWPPLSFASPHASLTA
jgi:hypothetical protein